MLGSAIFIMLVVQVVQFVQGFGPRIVEPDYMSDRMYSYNQRPNAVDPDTLLAAWNKIQASLVCALLSR